MTGVFSTAVKFIRDKKRLRNCSSMKGTKETGQPVLSRIVDRKEKYTHWDSWHNLMKVHKMYGSVYFSSLNGFIVVK